jgi:hypothetical protein
VFSSSLSSADWPETTISTGDLAVAPSTRPDIRQTD